MRISARRRAAASPRSCCCIHRWRCCDRRYVGDHRIYACRRLLAAPLQALPSARILPCGIRGMKKVMVRRYSLMTKP